MSLDPHPRHPRPTWMRLIGTLVIATAIVLGAITVLARPVRPADDLPFIAEADGLPGAALFPRAMPAEQ